jgi:large subunit ribosomal protein L25
MDRVILPAETRGTGRHQVKELRLQERVPAVIYGAAIEPQTVAVEARALHKALVAAGRGLITLEVKNAPDVQVLTREIQRDPVRRNIIHVDFLAVSLTDRLRVSVPVEQKGVAPVLEAGDYVLVRVTDSIEIECLPSDIPSQVVADVSKLETVDDSLLARDLPLPEHVTLVTAPDHVIFAVTVSRAAIEAAEEEAEEAVEEEMEADEVEVIAKGKAAKADEDFKD